MTTRSKLTIGFVAVIVVANSILSFVIVRHIGDAWLNEVHTSVRLDLNTARSEYDNHVERITCYLRGVSQTRSFAPADADSAKTSELLEAVRRDGELDFLTLVDLEGRVVSRAGDHGVASDDGLIANPLIAAVREAGQPLSGTLLLSEEALKRERPDLAQRARLTPQPTPDAPGGEAAASSNDEVNTDGMVAAAAVPVLGPSGDVTGFLYAGSLLNQSDELVDRIRDEVFLDREFEGRPTGTVTIFQGDLRIATNVIDDHGDRAVGTRLSRPVREAVLTGGEVYAGRAFVVNDWYITAYEPIRDPADRIIGALYVGLLEAPFVQRQQAITSVFLATVAFATILSLVLIAFVTRHLLSPIGRILAMMHRVIGGDLSARVGIRPAGEMGMLCESIDAMGEAVSKREEQLKQATQRQMGRSETLASIGRLAAGVAHEVNNPLTGILTFSHLLRQKENMDEQDKKDLDLIISETTRVAEIVRGLLDFARERLPSKEMLCINDIVERTLVLLRSQKQFGSIEIKRELDPKLPELNADRSQLKQVLLNLVLNACEAMPDGGTLTISTRRSDEDHIEVAIADTGIGLPNDHIGLIFEPFFTTKAVGKGTGLGLAVSYGIVEQHGGRLTAANRPSGGAIFTMTLPIREQDEGAPSEGVSEE